MYKNRLIESVSCFVFCFFFPEAKQMFFLFLLLIPNGHSGTWKTAVLLDTDSQSVWVTVFAVWEFQNSFKHETTEHNVRLISNKTSLNLGKWSFSLEDLRSQELGEENVKPCKQ